MNRAVLWELDGVVADTAEAHFRSWVTALAEWEIPLDRETLSPLLGLHNEEILAAVLGRPAEPRERGTILSRKEHFFRLESEHLVRLTPGVPYLLSALAADGWSQALFSMLPQATVDLVVDQLGIRDRFAAVLSAEGTARAKPEPTLLQLLARRLRIPPGACVVVDDVPAGLEAAHRAGMRCLAVANARPPAALGAADRIVSEMSGVAVATFSQLVENDGRTDTQA
jgi:HAD superfamily hydrolase (TIGR01509 family)